MSVITRVPEPNLWDLICKDFQSKKTPFRNEDDARSIHTVLDDYDPTKHHPVFFGNMFERVAVDANVESEFDPEKSHPALVGYAVLHRPPMSPPSSPPPLPCKQTCGPREYLELYVFPVLLPALEGMLHEAKLEKCFERKRTKFNALDFITEYLYRNNPGYQDRSDMTLADIPFVKEWWKEHPRPPLPKSLLWSDEEATLIVQSFWRGFKVRKDSSVSELRQWQREWREENENIGNKVNEFWSKQMPDGGDPSSCASDGQQELCADDCRAKSPARKEGGQDGSVMAPSAVANGRPVSANSDIGQDEWPGRS